MSERARRSAPREGGVIPGDDPCASAVVARTAVLSPSYSRQMDEARQERLAKNEDLFRTLNENIVEIAGSLGGDTPYEFICECATSGCFERILLTLTEYERVRQDGAHFLLKPGHEDIEVEQVVARYEGYLRRREGRRRRARRPRRRPARLTRSSVGGLERRSRDRWQR